jgi:hypothetical protein
MRCSKEGGADGDRPIAHAGKRGRMPDRATVEEDAFESAPVEKPEVALPADRGDRFPLLVARRPTGREGCVVDEDDARSLGDGGPERIEVEPPLAVGDVERGEPGNRPYEANAVQHARVGRVGEDDLVPGIGQAEERIEHCVALTARDHDFAPPVVARAAAALDVRGDRLLEIVATGEGQPAVRLVRADRRPRRLHRLPGRRDVGVEVLQAQDVRILTGRSGDAIDAEPRNVLEARDAHPLLLLSRRSLDRVRHS